MQSHEIRAGQRWMPWQDLWAYREVLYFLLWRNLIVRFKETALGATWLLVRPLLLAALFNQVFGKLPLASGSTPYVLVALSGLITWDLFAGAVDRASWSLLADAELLKKIYFPRLYLPLVAVLTGFVDYMFGLLAWLLLAVLGYGLWPSWKLVGVLPACLLLMTASLGLGLWLAALNLRYRDFVHVTPFLLQVGFFASPVIYDSHLLPAGWANLNPAGTAIGLVRWSLLADQPSPATTVLTSVLLTTLLLLSGLFYFGRSEGSLADVA